MSSIDGKCEAPAESSACPDLLQIHRADPHVPYEETMRALHDVVQSGKVRCEHE